MITFRDGRTGRPAGLVGGPDVWQVAMWLDDLAPGTDAASQLGADPIVTRSQIYAVLAYRAAYPAEIQTEIDRHRDATTARKPIAAAIPPPRPSYGKVQVWVTS